MFSRGFSGKFCIRVCEWVCHWGYQNLRGKEKSRPKGISQIAAEPPALGPEGGNVRILSHVGLGSVRLQFLHGTVRALPVFSGFSKHAFREEPFGFCRGTVPGATLVPPRCPRMPKNNFKEACPVPAPKARWYCKLLAVKCFPGCARGQYLGQPLSPQKWFENLVPGAKARLSGRHVWKMQIFGSDARKRFFCFSTVLTDRKGSSFGS